MTLPLLAKGKVREIYDLGGDLLMVASDRISTYDVVHPTQIPDKGKVLTGLSVLWFGLTGEIVPNHFLSATDGVPDELRGRGAAREAARDAAGRVHRARLHHRLGLEGLPARPARCRASSCREGLQESEQLPEPIFTPSTKAEEGHDEAIDLARAGRARRLGASSPGSCATSRSRSTRRSPRTRASAA